MAVTAVSMLPWPEMMTTGRSGCAFLMMLSTSRPSRRLPCSQMSRMTSCGRRSSTRFQRFVGIAGETRAVTVVLQEAGDHLADVRLVVDDQDVGCHLSLLHTLAITRRRWRRRLRARHAVVLRRRRPCSPAAKCGSGRRACVRAPAGRPRATACRRAAPRSSARWRGRGRCPCCPWW